MKNITNVAEMEREDTRRVRHTTKGSCNGIVGGLWEKTHSSGNRTTYGDHGEELSRKKKEKKRGRMLEGALSFQGMIIKNSLMIQAGIPV